jgi:cytoskeletal protein RodZ
MTQRKGGEQEARSLGDVLRSAREAKRLSLEDMNRLTRINPPYLEAIEDERFTDLPPPPYSQIFLSAYARAVGLSPREILERYLAMTGESPVRREALWEESEPATIAKKPGPLAWILIGLVVALAVGGVLFAILKIFGG